MINLYEDLSWLPKPPDDFSIRLSKASCGKDLQELDDLHQFKDDS